MHENSSSSISLCLMITARPSNKVSCLFHRYTSKFSGTVKQETKNVKSPAKTMVCQFLSKETTI